MALTRTDTPLFSEGASSRLRLIVYLVGALTLMITDHRGQYLHDIRFALSVVIEPVYRVAALPSQLLRNARLTLSDHKALAEENTRLHEALLLAEVQLKRLDTMHGQNLRLQELLEVQRTLGLGVQLAKLIDIDIDLFHHRMVLDAGKAEGVTVGLAVIDAQGVVGQVVEVLEHTAVVMLITDSKHGLPVTIERTGLRTIAYGSGAIDRLELPNIPISADIKPGDKLVTSGLGGRFPASFPVAELLSVQSDASGMFATASAVPSAALNRSSEVLLLRELAEPIGPPESANLQGPAAESKSPIEPYLNP